MQICSYHIGNKDVNHSILGMGTVLAMAIHSEMSHNLLGLSVSTEFNKIVWYITSICAQIKDKHGLVWTALLVEY